MSVRKKGVKGTAGGKTKREERNKNLLLVVLGKL